MVPRDFVLSSGDNLALKTYCTLCASEKRRRRIFSRFDPASVTSLLRCVLSSRDRTLLRGIVRRILRYLWALLGVTWFADA